MPTGNEQTHLWTVYQPLFQSGDAQSCEKGNEISQVQDAFPPSRVNIFPPEKFYKDKKNTESTISTGSTESLENRESTESTEQREMNKIEK